jgi:hypothetical protein
MLGVFKRLWQQHLEREEDIAAITKAHDEARRAGDEPEKSMVDTVFETYDKYPDGGPV